MGHHHCPPGRRRTNTDLTLGAPDEAFGPRSSMGRRGQLLSRMAVVRLVTRNHSPRARADALDRVTDRAAIRCRAM